MSHLRMIASISSRLEISLSFLLMPMLELLVIRELSSGQVVELGIGQIGIREHPVRAVHKRRRHQNAVARLDPSAEICEFFKTSSENLKGSKGAEHAFGFALLSLTKVHGKG